METRRAVREIGIARRIVTTVAGLALVAGCGSADKNKVIVRPAPSPTSSHDLGELRTPDLAEARVINPDYWAANSDSPQCVPANLNEWAEPPTGEDAEILSKIFRIAIDDTWTLRKGVTLCDRTILVDQIGGDINVTGVNDVRTNCKAISYSDVSVGSEPYNRVVAVCMLGRGAA